MLKVIGGEALLGCKPSDLGVSPWITVDQAKINGFADATDDHAWVHVDAERANREMPGGKTIAHGFLSLSLMPRMIDGIISIEGSSKGYIYGMDGLRFLTPVPVGSRIRLKVAIRSTEPRGPRDVKVVYDCVVEVEGNSRPALVCQWIALYFF